MTIDPPENAFWFSLADLKNFRKIALDQMQRKDENGNDLNMDDDDEPIGWWKLIKYFNFKFFLEKRSKEDINEGNDEYGDLENPPSSEEVICVDEDKVHEEKEKQSSMEYQDEEDNDIEVMSEENLAEKNPSPTGYDEQGKEIFDEPEDAAKAVEIIEYNQSGKKPVKFNQDIYCKHGNF